MVESDATALGCSVDVSDASMVDVFAQMSGLQEVVYRREGNQLVRRIKIDVPVNGAVAAHSVETIHPLATLPKPPKTP